MDQAIRHIRERRPRRIVFFTGAGISAESGIPTFRGAGGLWGDFRAEDLATPQGFARNPHLVWEWYEWRRGLIREARPNAAHESIQRLEAKLAHGSVTVVTQNIDGLHERAGSRNLVELHGNIFRARCLREGRIIPLPQAIATFPPLCDCGAMLRPDVVWFGEMLPDEAVDAATRAIQAADLLVVIGTSGLVYPAAGMVALHRGLSIEINPETSALSSACTVAIATTATAATPPLVDAILEEVSS
ncbi:MAG TPA: NAD-dependent deacylase [Thermoanaerobaculia bacterium]|nr:NAD-dependent deacylase [Thermoanaerobaculia bacterium]